MSESEQRLDQLFDKAFDANHPAMLDYVNLKFELKALTKERDSALEKLRIAREALQIMVDSTARYFGEQCDPWSESKSAREIALEALSAIAENKGEK